MTKSRKVAMLIVVAAVVFLLAAFAGVLPLLVALVVRTVVLAIPFTLLGVARRS
jgi:hypothetical protein